MRSTSQTLIGVVLEHLLTSRVPRSSADLISRTSRATQVRALFTNNAVRCNTVAHAPKC